MNWTIFSVVVSIVALVMNVVALVLAIVSYTARQRSNQPI